MNIPEFAGNEISQLLAHSVNLSFSSYSVDIRNVYNDKNKNDRRFTVRFHLTSSQGNMIYSSVKSYEWNRLIESNVRKLFGINYPIRFIGLVSVRDAWRFKVRIPFDTCDHIKENYREILAKLPEFYILKEIVK